MIDNPYSLWITDDVSSVMVPNNLHKAWGEGYSKGYANGQIKALKEDLEFMDKILANEREEMKGRVIPVCPKCNLTIMYIGDRIINDIKYALFRCSKCGYDELQMVVF